MKQNGRKEVYIISAGIDVCILHPFHFIISVTFFPHPLWAPVEITGEISVCGKACLSSRGNRGRVEGCLEVGKTKRKRKKRFMLCSTAVLFVALFPLCVWR